MESKEQSKKEEKISIHDQDTVKLVQHYKNLQEQQEENQSHEVQTTKTTGQIGNEEKSEEEQKIQYDEKNDIDDEDINEELLNKSQNSIFDDDYNQQQQDNNQTKKKNLQNNQNQNESDNELDYMDTDEDENYKKERNQQLLQNINNSQINRYQQLYDYLNNNLEEIDMQIVNVLEDFLSEININDAYKIDLSCIQKEIRELLEIILEKRLEQQKQKEKIKNYEKTLTIIIDKDEFGQSNGDIQTRRIVMVYKNSNQKYQRQHQDIYTYLANQFNCEMDDIVSYEYAEIEDMDEVKKKSDFFKLSQIYFQSSLPYMVQIANLNNNDSNILNNCKQFLTFLMLFQHINYFIFKKESTSMNQDQKIIQEAEYGKTLLKNGMKRLFLSLNQVGWKFSLYMYQFFEFAWDNSDKYISELTESYLEQMQDIANNFRVNISDDDIDSQLKYPIIVHMDKQIQKQEMQKIQQFLEINQKELNEDDDDDC
ncbi:hypothetical protein PPERSA_03780 [Pseudocohnilembus persalinus]|uniref:Uncharacterized protein n=1 Tax=Pseudocohnilembus persalinus TaxID=266149 RepID=A0A0V0R8E7_PSEPJ|nr:hypothetical protein PPERSA_03780 [Pseudocohnilembus persalinus]|eukprot:KRX10722.1 hypothetical protein PPERSA_03780 [Pseudocohnilembus persalinus]